MSYHHYLYYGDPERVRMARVEAKRRIAIRNLKAAVLAPAEKLVGWLNRRLP